MVTWVCRLELGRLGGIWGCLFPLELKVNLQKVVIFLCFFFLRLFPRKGHDDGGPVIMIQRVTLLEDTPVKILGESWAGWGLPSYGMVWYGIVWGGLGAAMIWYSMVWLV